jgi:hypothetical protein
MTQKKKKKVHKSSIYRSSAKTSYQQSTELKLLKKVTEVSDCRLQNIDSRQNPAISSLLKCVCDTVYISLKVVYTVIYDSLCSMECVPGRQN